MTMGEVVVGKVKERGNRMNRTVRWMAAALCAVGLVQAAEAEFSVGGKLWMVNFDDAVGLDSTIMFGPKIDLSGETFWLSGSFLFGSADSNEPYYGVDESTDMQDGEVLLGMSFSFIDVGLGFRDTTFGYKEKGKTADKLTIWGPMVYVGTGSMFGESPLGWYVGASFMFLDLGDLSDVQDVLDSAQVNEKVTGEHYNIEVGLSATFEHFSATAGYRYKAFLNFDDDTQSGIAVSASFIF
jgi:hypothetical protein